MNLLKPQVNFAMLIITGDCKCTLTKEDKSRVLPGNPQITLCTDAVDNLMIELNLIDI